jgi:hypothetical protein
MLPNGDIYIFSTGGSAAAKERVLSNIPPQYQNEGKVKSRVTYSDVTLNLAGGNGTNCRPVTGW